MKAMAGGKMEKCFGVALKGQNDCYAGRDDLRRNAA